MLPYTLIEKKQAGQELNSDEISFFIKGFLDKSIPAYQMSALLMAIYFKGMSQKEISTLIQIIIESGVYKKFRDEGVYYVDKHSTGGVGDKVSLILAPLAISSGAVRVPMISGRGLGHSGGTLDKLETIPGFNTNLDMDAFERLTKDVGCALIGQTKDICPADKELYALRDVTATVRSIPLICASILSKKIAEGIQGLVLDVKTGNGAFMQTLEKSQELASQLVHFGEGFGLSVKAMITDMNQPLGNKIGNWLEVEESIDVLLGKGPKDLRDVTLALTAQMIHLSDPSKKMATIEKTLNENLENGKAFEKFLEIAKAQGGDISFLEHPEKYQKAGLISEIKVKENGYLESVDTYQLGLDSITLGAGRRINTDIIDPVAGIEIHKKIGDKITSGDVIFTLHSNKKEEHEKLKNDILSRIKLAAKKTTVPPLFYPLR